MLLKPAEVRAFLGWRPEQDAKLVMLIQAAEVMLDKYCDRTFEAVTNADYIASARGGYLRMKTYPLTLVKVAKWDLDEDEPDMAAEDVELLEADSDYIVAFDVGRITFSDREIERVKLRISGGYTSATLPADLKLALTAQVAFLAVASDPDNVNLSSKTVDKSTSRFRDGDMCEQMRSAVELYRRRVA